MMSSNQIKKTFNILDLRDSPWVDGPGRTILDCAESIEGEDFHFVIGSFSGGTQKTNAYAEDARQRGLEVVSIPEKSSFDRTVIPYIRQIIKQYDIDLIHTHDFRSNVFGLLCAKMSGITAIATTHGWIAYGLKSRIFIMIDKILLRFFDHILTVSERTRGLLGKYLIPKKMTTVVINALKIEDYKIDRNENTFRDYLGINKESILIANIGRLSPEKGQLLFLQAAKEVLKIHDNIKFVLIGIGPDEEALKKYVNDNGLEDHVVFAGFRKNMVAIYNSIDLIVQSSYTEGMPNVILEALLMSLPVIATDVGGTAEIVKHNENGVLIMPGSVSILNDAISKFIENRDSYLEMAARGKKLIESEFSHTARVEKIVRIYSRYTKRTGNI